MIDNTNSNKIFTKQNTYVIAQVFCGMGMLFAAQELEQSSLEIVYILLSIYIGLVIAISLFASYKMLVECNLWNKVLIAIIQASTIGNIIMLFSYKMTNETPFLMARIVFRSFNMILSLGIAIIFLIALFKRKENNNQVQFLSSYRNVLVHLLLLLA